MTEKQMADTGHEPDTATKQEETTNNSISYEDIMNNTTAEKNSQESSNIFNAQEAVYHG
jgi:hypothetical protein